VDLEKLLTCYVECNTIAVHSGLANSLKRVEVRSRVSKFRERSS